MDTRKLRSRQKKLENDITENVSKLVEGFKVETGISPRITLLETFKTITRDGERELEYKIEGCKVEIYL